MLTWPFILFLCIFAKINEMQKNPAQNQRNISKNNKLAYSKSHYSITHPKRQGFKKFLKSNNKFNLQNIAEPIFQSWERPSNPRLYWYPLAYENKSVPNFFIRSQQGYQRSMVFMPNLSFCNSFSPFTPIWTMKNVLSCNLFEF